MCLEHANLMQMTATGKDIGSVYTRANEKIILCFRSSFVAPTYIIIHHHTYLTDIITRRREVCGPIVVSRAQ